VELTTTSYALLGLLSLRPWTTYELAQQVQRSLRGLWPVAERQLYEQPKTLVAHGLATSTKERTGDRPRTVYRITPAGRAALRGWLEDPTGDITLRSELLLKAFFAEQAGKPALLRQIDTLRRLATGTVQGQAAAYEASKAGGFPFPDRLHLAAVVARLGLDLMRTIEAWADWAEAEVAGWPDDLAPPPDAVALADDVYLGEGPTGPDRRR
jgi:DNA-binding PadR family transcriptional regulator